MFLLRPLLHIVPKDTRVLSASNLCSHITRNEVRRCDGGWAADNENVGISDQVQIAVVVVNVLSNEMCGFREISDILWDCAL